MYIYIHVSELVISQTVLVMRTCTLTDTHVHGLSLHIWPWEVLSSMSVQIRGSYIKNIDLASNNWKIIYICIYKDIHFQNIFWNVSHIYLLHFPEQARESVMRQTVWRNRVKNTWKRAQFSFSKHIYIYYKILFMSKNWVDLLSKRNEFRVKDVRR